MINETSIIKRNWLKTKQQLSPFSEGDENQHGFQRAIPVSATEQAAKPNFLETV
jgi:hypothetical protein